MNKDSENQQVPSGNASNPSPDDSLQSQNNQLIDKKGEKYLREVANPEDYADPEDVEEMEDTIKKDDEKSSE